jgi:hypothetical protein
MCPNVWNDLQVKPKYSQITCPSASLSIINPTLLEADSNPEQRRGKLAANRLSYGTAKAIPVTGLGGIEDREM